MRAAVQLIVSSVFLVVTVTHASAGSVGGLEISPGANFAVTQVYENVPVAVGDTLAGYGKVESINSIAVASLCSGCELTYRFGGYTVSSVTPTEVRFTGGFVNLYLGFGADRDFTTANAGGSAGDVVEATNGTRFLSLKGHAVDAAGNTFVGTGTSIGTLTPTGFGTGLLDVDTSASGVANAIFNTNSIAALFGGAADFEIGYSFSALNPVYAAECPGGAACVRGSGDLTTTADPVGEPERYVVLLIGGLCAVAFVVRRRLS
jgi:hypothetical protein